MEAADGGKMAESRRVFLGGGDGSISFRAAGWICGRWEKKAKKVRPLRCGWAVAAGNSVDRFVLFVQDAREAPLCAQEKPKDKHTRPSSRHFGDYFSASAVRSTPLLQMWRKSQTSDGFFWGGPHSFGDLLWRDFHLLLLVAIIFSFSFIRRFVLCEDFNLFLSFIGSWAVNLTSSPPGGTFGRRHRALAASWLNGVEILPRWVAGSPTERLRCLLHWPVGRPLTGLLITNEISFFFSLDKDETLGVLFLAHLSRDTIWSEKKLNFFPMKFDAVKVDDVFWMNGRSVKWLATFCWNVEAGGSIVIRWKTVEHEESKTSAPRDAEDTLLPPVGQQLKWKAIKDR